MAKRQFTAALIAAIVSLPYPVGVGSPDAGPDASASVSERRGALEGARDGERALAPKATPARREENARTPPGFDSSAPLPVAALAPPPEIKTPVAPIPSGNEEALAAMRREMDQLRLQLAQQQNRVAALEAEAANEQARRSRDAEERNRRQRDLSAILSVLADIDRTLASGSGQVSDELARAQAAAASVASSAAAAGSALQSAHASDAQSWLAASREALARSDLYEARLAVHHADDSVRAAALATAVPGPEAQGVPE